MGPTASCSQFSLAAQVSSGALCNHLDISSDLAGVLYGERNAAAPTPPPAFRCGFTTVRCLKRRLATDNPPSFIVVPLAVRCLTLSGTGITNTMATSSGVVGVQVTAALLDHGCALPSS